MTATYDPTLATDLDWMRDALGDTDTSAALYEDEAYAAYLDAADDNWRLGAAAMARRLASRYANRPTSLTSDDGSGIRWGDRVANWLKTAAQLEAEAARLGVGGAALWSADPERSDISTSAGEYSAALRRG